MAFDSVAAVETLYRTDLQGPEWVLAALQVMQPLLDPEGVGVHGGFFHCADPSSFTPEPPQEFGLGDRLRSVLEEGLFDLGEEFVSGSFLYPGVVRAASVSGWNEIASVKSGALRAQGLTDALNLVAVEPDGAGCVLASFRADRDRTAADERHLVGAIFRHFVAAHRLKRRAGSRPIAPDDCDAVLDANGKIHHARGAATQPALAAALRKAVTRAESARGRQRRDDPHGALDAWESLVARRWTLVDHFDVDGRRYLLAVRNTPASFGPELLSPRERLVVERALLGHSNKVIAYDLGIGHSTVRVLMARAAAKLGARTRRELLHYARSQRNE